MDRRARRPAEPEQAGGDEERADHSGLQTDLGPEFAICVELGLDESIAVVVKGHQDDQGADEDAEEGEAFEALGEVVDIAEDDGEGLEPEVEETIGESDVEVEREANGFLQGEGERPDEDHEEDFLCGHAFGFELWLAYEVGVAGSLADVDSAAVDDIAGAGLWEEEDEEDQAEAGEPHELPERPLPALTFSGKATNERTHGWTEYR